MKKMLSITLVMLLVMGLVFPTGALAYTYTELTEEDTNQFYGEPLTSIKLYRDGSYEHFNSDGTHCPNDYLEASVSGETLTLKVVQTSGDNDTCSFGAITYDHQSEVDANDVQIQNGMYTATLNLSQFDGTQSLSIEADVDQTGSDAAYCMGSFIDDCRLYKINGNWCFRYYGNVAVERETNKEYMDILNNYKNPDNTNLKDCDIGQSYKDKANELCAGLTDDFSKAYVIYKWITDNFNYGDTKIVDGIGESYGMVCADFGYTMKRMCNAVGIPCATPGGIPETYSTIHQAKNHGNIHEWNAVYADGRWMMCDASAKSPFDMTYDYFCSEYNMSGAGVDPGESDVPSNKDQHNGNGNGQGNGSVCTRVAKHNTLTILMDGKPIKVNAYNIDNNNYIKLRAVAYLINNTGKKFSVNWDAANNAIKLVSGENYIADGGELIVGSDSLDRSATPTSSTVYFNGKQVCLTAYTIMGNNYFKLRDIGSTMDFGVNWDSSTGEVSVVTTQGYAS